MRQNALAASLSTGAANSGHANPLTPQPQPGCAFRLPHPTTIESSTPAHPRTSIHNARKRLAPRNAIGAPLLAPGLKQSAPPGGHANPPDSSITRWWCHANSTTMNPSFPTHPRAREREGRRRSAHGHGLMPSTQPPACNSARPVNLNAPARSSRAARPSGMQFRATRKPQGGCSLRSERSRHFSPRHNSKPSP